MPNFRDFYRLQKLNHPRRGRTHSRNLSRRLVDDVRVLWAEQQFAKRRQKRGFLPVYPPPEAEDFQTEESETEKDRPLVRVKRESPEGL